MSQRDLSAQAEVSRNSLSYFENAQQTPRVETLRKLERYFGWDQGLLTKLIASDEPWQVANIDDLTGGLPEAKLSDEALLWELTHRMQTKDQTIEELRDRVQELEAEIARLREP